MPKNQITLGKFQLKLCVCLCVCGGWVDMGDFLSHSEQKITSSGQEISQPQKGLNSLKRNLCPSEGEMTLRELQRLFCKLKNP